MMTPESIAPLVSVVIPAYNCAAYLPRALESVFAQTLREIEVVVVDDGSTDGTPDAIAPWRDRIVYIAQRNAGVAAARNAGIAASTAPYVAFLDADDLWLPAKLEKQLASLESDPRIGMMCTDFSVRYSDGRCLDSFLRREPPLAGDMFIRMVENCFAPPSVVMVRRDVLRKLAGFDTSPGVAEDLNLWLRISHDYKVAVIPEVLCIKRQRTTTELLHPQHRVLRSQPAVLGDAGAQASKARPYELTVTSEIGALRAVLTEFPEMSRVRQRAVIRQLGNFHYCLGKHFLLRKDKMAARQNLGKALTTLPVTASLFIALSVLPAAVIQGMSQIKRRFA